MGNTTAFETTDFIQYMSLNVIDELNQLDEYIEAKDAKKVRGQFNHCSSLLTGIHYTLEYIKDEKIREELQYAVDNMKNLLNAKHERCKAIIKEAGLN